MSDTRLTNDERSIVELLGLAWDRFCKLPVEHPNDTSEFLQAIHSAQRIALARPARREINRV